MVGKEWFRIAVAAVFLLGIPAQAELSLGQLRAKFEAAIEAEQSGYSEKTGKLREGYHGALDRLKASLGKEGKFEQAKQVLGELDLLEKGEELGKLPKNVDYRFQTLRSKWERSQAELDEDHAEKLVELAKTYLKVLEDRKESLTRAGKIREASVVDEELKRVQELDVVVKALSGGPDGGGLQGEYGDGNIALAKLGAKAKAPENAKKIIDGPERVYEGKMDSWAFGFYPCTFEVTLPDVHVVSEIRLLFPDQGSRRLNYKVEVSVDGETWVLVEDRSKKSSSGGWKKVEFEPQDVMKVRIQGLGNTANRHFHLGEVEVYSPEQ